MLGLPSSFARCWWARGLRTERIGRSLINIRCAHQIVGVGGGGGGDSSISSKAGTTFRLRSPHSFPRPRCLPPAVGGHASPPMHASAFRKFKPTASAHPRAAAARMPPSAQSNGLCVRAGFEKRGERFSTHAESTSGGDGGSGGGYESKFYGTEMARQAERKYGPKTEYVKHRKGKKVKGRRIKASPKNYKGNKQSYKNLVFKWFLQAYPESLSRQEIAGRLNAHPKKVKGLIIKALVREGKLVKWGQRTAPFERYMPVIKAPEYYEVTGEEPPKMPDIDENEIFRNKAPRKMRESMEAPVDMASIPMGFQDTWDEGGQLGETDVQKLQEISSLQGWNELFEDTSDEEEGLDDGGEEDEATLLARVKAGREREQRRARGEVVDSDDDDDDDEEDSDEEYEVGSEGEDPSDEEGLQGEDSDDESESGAEGSVQTKATTASGADDLLREASFALTDEESGGGTSSSSPTFPDFDFGSSELSSSSPSSPAESENDAPAASSSETESKALSVSDLASDPFFNPKKIEFDDSVDDSDESFGRAVPKRKRRSKKAASRSSSSSPSWKDEFDSDKFEQEISSSTASSKSFKDYGDSHVQPEFDEEEVYYPKPGSDDFGSRTRTRAYSSSSSESPFERHSVSSESALSTQTSDVSSLPRDDVDDDDGEFLPDEDGDDQSRPPLNIRTPRRR